MSVVTPPATNTEIGNSGAGASLTQLSAIAWAISNIDLDTIQTSRLVPAFSSGTTREFSWFQNKNFRVIRVRGVSNGGSGASASITFPNTSNGDTYSYRYDTYSTIQLTCSPAYGFTFSHWAYGSSSAPTSGAISNSNPVSIASTDWTSTSYFNIWCVCSASASNYFCAVPGFFESLTDPPQDSAVNTIAVTNDSQKIYCGGPFRYYRQNSYNGIIRLNLDGSIDTSFNVGTGFSSSVSSWTINQIVVQPDNKIIVVGRFTAYKGNTHNNIIRLNADGSVDTGFNVGTGFNNLTVGNYEARSIKLYSDGKILVCGHFNQFNGTSIGRGIIRLNSDGTRDTSFSSGSTGVTYPLPGYYPYIATIDIQSDGKIICGGEFEAYNGTGRNYILRLNSDGTLDTSFNPGTGFSGVAKQILIVKILSNGKILVGGQFDSYNGNSAVSAIRINSDASYDSSFTFSSPQTNYISDIVLTSNGKYLFLGRFFNYNGQSIWGIVMTETSGSQYTTFNVGVGVATGNAYTAVEMPSGQFYVGGGFDNYKSQYVGDCLILLNPNGDAIETCSWSVNYAYSKTSLGGTLTIKKNGTNQVVNTTGGTVTNAFNYINSDTILVDLQTTSSQFFFPSVYALVRDRALDDLWTDSDAPGGNFAQITSPNLDAVGNVNVTANSSEY
jgi:uncharacterized delta-60 repeat protein